MPVSKKPNNKYKKTQFMGKLMMSIGGSKLQERLIKGRIEYLNADKQELYNYGLPPITDMEGPAEC